MGQSWSSRAAKNPTYERRRRKDASKSKRVEGTARTNADCNHPGGTNSLVQRRESQTVSNGATLRLNQRDRRQTPSYASIPDRHRNHKDTAKKPEPGRIKSKRVQESHVKHKSVNRRDSHQNHHETYRPEHTQKIDCVVCTDMLSLHHFPDRPPTKDCKHGVDACRKCLRTWIESEFSTKMWNDIKCPICSISMESADMREFAPKEIVKRYIKLYNRAKEQARPGFTWCNLKGCEAGQVHLPYTPRFRCNTCEKASCVVHHVKWHKGETCSEYDYRTNARFKAEEEEASKRVMEATTKQCPGCKSSIEKNMGCDHMECTKCRVHFCWGCLLPYRSDVSRRAREAGGGKYCECYLLRA